MLKDLQSYIDGSFDLKLEDHIDCGDHFTKAGYQELIPEHVIDTKSELVHHFYTDGNIFRLGAQYLPKLRTVAKMTKDGKNVEFAASFILVELDNYLVAFLDVIRTGDKCQRKGLGSIFIDTLVGFMEQTA